jgi:broad specificity phosphatase PhoE
MTSDTTRILLIRHAHVDTGPPPGRLCGSCDLPLSPKGREQIRMFQESLVNGSRPDALYTSSLLRARATANALAGAWRLEPVVETALSEIHCGRLDGICIKEIEREHPDLWARNRAQNDDDFTWPGGESYRQFRQRALAALHAIAQRHPHQRVAIVTHAGVITQVIGAIHGRPAAAWAHHRADPFSATEMLWTNGSPQSVLRFGQAHWWQ